MRDSAPNEANLAPSTSLLAWYDRHARQMPWRVPPAQKQAGVRPDPYRTWLSEVMLQQTTVAAVGKYFARFTTLWPRVEDLAAAADADVMAEWAGLGYYARARNLLKCARAVTALGGFPKDHAGLLALPGVGPYTAASVAAIAYDAPVTVVDGNVERVMARFFAHEEPMPRAKPALRRLADRLTPPRRTGDYAQAVMDLGATICTPRNPACAICPWHDPCQARAQGIAPELPRKLPKSEKPTRHGTVWLLRSPQGWLLETRPAKGLLGGMLGLLGDGWDGAGGAAPTAAPWQSAGTLRHTFSHFHLVLEVLVAHSAANPTRGHFIATESFEPTALPTVFRKAFDLGSRALSPD